MLPSWRDEVRIALCPDRVTLARVSRRGRPEIIAKHVVHCSAPGTSDWKPCVEALHQALLEPFLHNADATVVISNHFVRYAMVPWSEHLVSDDEKRAWVKHHFVELYGELPGATEYRWSEERPDTACVATAVDGEFIAEIRAAFEPASLRLRSVQPYLMAVFNRWKQHAKGNAAWILVAETGRACIAAVANGEWRTITSKKIGLDWQAELPLALGRELLLADDTSAPTVILAYAPDVTKLDFPAWNEVPVKVLAPRALRGFSPYSDAQYAMALTGVV
ncbi:MAG TPA: hypothetical protein VGQ88_09580 [Burkholderiales bacterium]|nr:hypothetical protein [Burkholderiales bacterium]